MPCAICWRWPLRAHALRSAERPASEAASPPRLFLTSAKPPTLSRDQSHTGLLAVQWASPAAASAFAASFDTAGGLHRRVQRERNGIGHTWAGSCVDVRLVRLRARQIIVMAATAAPVDRFRQPLLTWN